MLGVLFGGEGPQPFFDLLSFPPKNFRLKKTLLLIPKFRKIREDPDGWVFDYHFAHHINEKFMPKIRVLDPENYHETIGKPTISICISYWKWGILQPGHVSFLGIGNVFTCHPASPVFSHVQKSQILNPLKPKPKLWSYKPWPMGIYTLS